MKQLTKRLVNCDLAGNGNTLAVGNDFIDSPFWFRVTPQQAHEQAKVLVEYSAQYFFYGPSAGQQ